MSKPERHLVKIQTTSQPDLRPAVWFHGSFVPNNLDRHSLLSPIDRVIPTIKALVDGKMIDWQSENVVAQTLYQLTDSDSLLNRTIGSMVSNQKTAEATEAFRLLGQNLDSFSPNISLLTSPKHKLQEWWLKLIIGLKTHSSIAIYNKLGGNQQSSEAANYQKLVENQVSRLTETIAKLTLGELSYYIRFADLWYQDIEPSRSSGQTNNAKLLKRIPLKSVQEKLAAALDEVDNEEDILLKNLFQEDSLAWERLKIDWGWSQLEEVLRLLPSLRSDTALTNTIAALESNLLALTKSPNGKTAKISLEPEAITTLLRHDWKDSNPHWLSEKYPLIFSLLETPKEFPDFSVPRKYLPAAAIDILTEVMKIEDREKLQALITPFHDRMAEDKSLTVPWLLTLLVLKAANPQIAVWFHENIDSLKNLPENYRQVLLNQEPGKLWLTSSGRLHLTTDPNKTLQAFPLIYISRFI